MNKTGGCFSLLSSLIYLILGIIVAVQPVVSMTSKVDIYLNTMVSNPTLLILNYLFMGLTGIFGLGLVEEITKYLEIEEVPIIKTAKKLAYVGYAVIAISYFKALTMKPYMANVYVGSNESVKQIISTVDPFLAIAPNGIVTIGAIGVWMLLVNIFSYKLNKCSKFSSIIGIMLGISMILMVVPIIGNNAFMVISIIKGVLSCVWFGYIGIKMIKTSGHMGNKGTVESL